jgi:hypothetical protein
VPEAVLLEEPLDVEEMEDEEPVVAGADVTLMSAISTYLR